MRFFALLTAAFCLLGCQALQPQGEAAQERERHAENVVVTTSADAVSDCRKVGEVSVAAPFPFLNQAFPDLTSVGKQESRKDLRRATRQAGGDTVLQTGPRGGTAYDCRRGSA